MPKIPIHRSMERRSQVSTVWIAYRLSGTQARLISVCLPRAALLSTLLNAQSWRDGSSLVLIPSRTFVKCGSQHSVQLPDIPSPSCHSATVMESHLALTQLERCVWLTQHAWLIVYATATAEGRREYCTRQVTGRLIEFLEQIVSSVFTATHFELRQLTVQ
jgi:hypothetical protein